MFELKAIEVKNFLSFGRNPTRVDFTEGRSWGIAGPNGCGKSTLIEAIHFGLFGAPYRGAKIDDLVNRVNKEDCLVTVEFNVDNNSYVIERGLKPKVLNVTYNGSSLQENVSKRDFQKTIDEIIGVPYDVFSQLTVVDSTYHTPFMELDAKDRRAIIDKIFGLDKITRMLERSREFKLKISNKIIESKSKVELCKEKIRLNEQFALAALEKEITDKQVDIERIDGEVKDITDRYVELETERTSEERQLETTLKELETLKVQIDGYEKVERELEQKVMEHERHERLLKEGKCKECGRVFENAADELLAIAKLKSESEGQLDALKTNELQPLYERFKLVSSEIALIRQRVDKIKTERSLLVKQEGKLIVLKEKETVELETLRTKKETGAVDTTQIQMELTTAQNVLVQDNYMHSQVLECEKILSDGGVRSYIIKKFLPTFNSTMKKYLTQMDAGFAFTFNDEFESIEDARYRNSFAYGNLSSGQKGRVHFAIIFTMLEFLEKRSNIKTDFIILDEALEGNGIDSEGKSLILTILKRVCNKKIIVISHDQSVQDNFEKKLKLEIRGSFSHIFAE